MTKTEIKEIVKQELRMELWNFVYDDSSVEGMNDEEIEQFEKYLREYTERLIKILK